VKCRGWFRIRDSKIKKSNLQTMKMTKIVLSETIAVLSGYYNILLSLHSWSIIVQTETIRNIMLWNCSLSYIYYVCYLLILDVFKISKGIKWQKHQQTNCTLNLHDFSFTGIFNVIFIAEYAANIQKTGLLTYLFCWQYSTLCLLLQLSWHIIVRIMLSIQLF